MRPVLVSFGGGVDLESYFTLLALGFCAAALIAWRGAKKEGLPTAPIVDLALWSVIWGMVGARIAHVLFDGYFWDYVHLCTDPGRVAWHVPQAECVSHAIGGRWDAAAGVCRPPGRDCFAWARFWQGGLTYYGGLLAAIGWAIYFLRREGLRFLQVADLVAPGIAVAVFFARIGCFLSGCCFGARFSRWPAVRFPPYSPASLRHFQIGALPTDATVSLPVHPAQLYEGFLSLAIAAILVTAVAPRKRHHGEVLAALMILYGAARFLVEFVRDDDRGAFLSFSTSQWISLLLAAAAIGGVAVLRRASPAGATA